RRMVRRAGKRGIPVLLSTHHQSTPRSPRPRLRPRLEPLGDRCLPSTYSVTTTADNGPGSLREAISSIEFKPGYDRIEFDIPGNGFHSIQVLSRLPRITKPVSIDGTTQPGYRSGHPVIELNGTHAGKSTSGLQFDVSLLDQSTVRGLVIDS